MQKRCIAYFLSSPTEIAGPRCLLRSELLVLRQRAASVAGIAAPGSPPPPPRAARARQILFFYHRTLHQRLYLHQRLQRLLHLTHGHQSGIKDEDAIYFDDHTMTMQACKPCATVIFQHFEHKVHVPTYYLYHFQLSNAQKGNPPEAICARSESVLSFSAGSSRSRCWNRLHLWAAATIAPQVPNNSTNEHKCNRNVKNDSIIQKYIV